MPSLQLDLPTLMSAPAKAALARELGALYSEVMQVRPDIVTVVIRDHGPGTVWRCTAGSPVPSALVMCDIRRGRSRSAHAELATRLVAACTQHAGVDALDVKVEFTLHDGEDMFHPRLAGFNTDWSEDERDA